MNKFTTCLCGLFKSLKFNHFKFILSLFLQIFLKFIFLLQDTGPAQSTEALICIKSDINFMRLKVLHATLYDSSR